MLCSKGACTFRLWASWMSDEESFQIKSLKAYHNCARNFNFGSLVTYAWIGSHYTKESVESQKISVRKLRLKVKAKFGIQVSMGQCRRAKKYALKLVEGSLIEHYGKLWSYGHEILRTNLGSTGKLDMEDGPDGKKYFRKFYCCFQGVKQGWIEGCRRVIGLDGCFLKGVYKGELLCAIGRDANEKIYPIAWAVVNVENKQNWKWFLELLIDDLNLNLGNGFSLMSDQHKTLNPDAHQYLMEKDPKTLSRAFFQTGRCCDAVENGFSESFNVVIVDARKKPIITMLKEMRLYMMDRIYNMKLKGQQWGNHICPEIRDKVNLLKKAQRHYQVLPSGLNQFEVRGEIDTYEVHLESKTCSCRLWQLNGYGCAHSIASISFLNRDVEAYVDNMFSTTTFRKAYNYRIAPMNSNDMWPETNYTPPLPPINRRMPGRPATKRKKSTTENTGTHRVSKARKKIRCSICKEIGHNKATCPQRRSQKLNVKKQKKQEVCVKQNAGQGSTSEPQQHEEVEMTPIEMDTTQNDMQVAPTDVESSSAGDFSHYMQFTPPRCYEGDEGVMGEEADVVEEAVKDEEAEEVDHVIQVDNVNVHNVDEVSVRPISEILKRIRRRKSERILKLKLGKTICGVDDPRNSKGKALDVGTYHLTTSTH
uniref:SWIM-type domain-containing protein n=1 Tax=Lactuca sativa TaxID=4236 RepID=A0A9R1VIX1_LACSA|nr:hypothetical protein LSAT_V11C500241920 [Lactuca sativa]